MGWYRDAVLPRVLDRMCGTAEIAEWRGLATAGLSGQLLEIGFGSGLNVAHYPAGVRSVVAVEPSSVARRLADRRSVDPGLPVTFVGIDGEHLPLEDESCDSALSTFTLCTIPDAAQALRELRRVLRPGGTFHFLEHGLAPDARVASWQRRLEPLQLRLAGGCHLLRDPVALVGAAGLRIDSLQQSYSSGPKPWSWFSVGQASRPEQEGDAGLPSE
jgi:SAM-dependent methyltransferase